MKKSPESVRKIVIASIKRKGGKVESWKFSKYYSEGEEIDRRIADNLSLDKSEFPVIQIYQDEGNWTLLTTHALIGMYAHQLNHLPLDNKIIQSYDLGMFKMPRGEPVVKEMSFELVDNKQIIFIQESLDAGRAILYALRYILNTEKDYL